MKVLIIGGTRFIGPYVVKNLLGLGHEVSMFHRGQSNGALHAPLPSDVIRISGDRDCLEDYKENFQQLEPEVVLDMVLSNERQAEVLMKVFRGVARRVVAISSIDVYRAHGMMHGKEEGPLQSNPITENSALRSKMYPYRGVFESETAYHYDKILVENVVMNDPDLPATVLRLPMVYGPGDYQHRLYPYIKRMQDRRPAILFELDQADWRASRGYVENVAHAIALAVTTERAAGQIYNVGEEAISERQWVSTIGGLMGWNGNLVTAHTSLLPSGIHFKQHWVVDTSRIRAMLGFKEIVQFDDGLRRTIQWELQNPPHDAATGFDYAKEDDIINNL
jgi:nucleoside-diphosphate-sugar epimerase